MTDRSQVITLPDAIAMTARARKMQLLPINAWLFDRQILDQILGQPGATGIRFYVGVDASIKPTLVAVGVTSDDKDMTAGTLGEYGMPCPPYCDDGSALLLGEP